MLFEIDVFEPSYEVNTAALAHIDWFYDECFWLLAAKLRLKISVVRW